MPDLKERVEDFLAQERIAVAGVSRHRQDAANAIYRKLESQGYQVIAVNPAMDSFEGKPCYPDVKSIPGKVDAVMIVTRPEVTERIVEDCAELGVSRIWMHQSMAMLGTSVSADAVDFCRRNGIAVIAGACPMMYCEPVDAGHKCMRWILGVFGRLPE